MPLNFSIPLRLQTYFYYGLSVVLLLFIPLSLYNRFAADGSNGLGAVFGSPDPMLCNTFTMCTAMGTLAMLLARYEKLRDELTGALLFCFIITVITTIPWLMMGNPVIQTRGGTWVGVPSYYVFHVVVDGLAALLIVLLRKATYTIDYIISSMTPSSARNVEALDASFFKGDEQDQASVLQLIDRYIAGIRGRKRGLLNFPF